MGDFNLPGRDWVQEQGKGREDEDFLVLVQDCFLTQFDDKPMRGSAVLDLLLSNDPKYARRQKCRGFTPRRNPYGNEPLKQLAPFAIAERIIAKPVGPDSIIGY